MCEQESEHLQREGLRVGARVGLLPTVLLEGNGVGVGDGRFVGDSVGYHWQKREE